MNLNPLNHGEGRCTPPSLILVFCPLLKISLSNPNLKMFDLAKRFVVDAPMKKINFFLFYPLSE